MSLQVSVIVPTYRRPDLLRKCLEALVRQRFPPQEYEIIVVDNAGSEGTRSLVESFSSKAVSPPGSGPETGPSPRIRYAAATHTRGPAAARNLGWRLAQGDVIAFTDDDCLPEPDWLEQGLSALRAGLDAACGRIVVPISGQPTDYERTIYRLTECEFATANCFCRRPALEACGGFDERYTMAWREDSDLHFRLLALSYAVGSAPAARVVHPVRQTHWGISIREQRKSMFNALLYKKFPHLYRTRIQPRPPLRYYGILLSALGSVSFGLTGNRIAAGSMALAWALLTLQFAFARLHRTRRNPSHVLEMLYTSVLIPPLAIFWRLYGAVRYRVLFF